MSAANTSTLPNFSAKEVARTADEVLQMRRWRRSGRREGSFSFYERGEGPKPLKEFAERVFDIKIGAINLSNTSSLLP
jgi:hypothetical protein